jgi:hypothetical protein
LKIIDEVRNDFEAGIIKANSSWFFDIRIFQIELHWPSAVFDIIQFKERASYQLMFTFVFIPIPAFNFESSKFIFRAYKSADWDCDWLPAWRKVVLNDLGSGDFHKRVVSSEFHEPQVRVTFVPKIKVRIYVFYLLSSPFHDYCHFIK